MREIEFEHLRARLQEAEEAAKVATPIIEAPATVTTQVDPPTPTVIETTLVSTGPPELQAPLSFPVSELIFREEEKESDIFSPPAKRPATQSPTPEPAATDGDAYPPLHHGPAVQRSRPSSVGVQIKRGRGRDPRLCFRY